MIIILGSNDTEITLTNKRFMCIVKVGFLNKEEVWGKVGYEVSKICGSGEEGVGIVGGEGIVGGQVSGRSSESLRSGWTNREITTGGTREGRKTDDGGRERG